MVDKPARGAGAGAAGAGGAADHSTAVVKWYDCKKRYGFITDVDSQTDYFVHHRDLKPQRTRSPMLYTGEYVQYTRCTADDGRPQAREVSGPLVCEARAAVPQSSGSLR